MKTVELNDRYEIRYCDISTYLWVSLYEKDTCKSVATVYNGDSSEGYYGEWRIQSFKDGLGLTRQEVVDLLTQYFGVQ